MHSSTLSSAAADDTLPGLSEARPARLAATLELSDASRHALDGDPSASAWLSTVLRAGACEDAIQYLAHALPRAAAVRWACECVRARPTAPCDDTLAVAVRWAATQQDAAVAEAAVLASTPAVRADGALRFALLAVAWSGPGPDGMPAMPPDPALGAAAVAASVLIASTEGGADGIAERQRTCIARGILIARDLGAPSPA